MSYRLHLVLSMLLKNTCHMWYSSIFQKELRDVYRGEGSILMLLWHKLEQLHCSVIFSLDFIQHYSRDNFTQSLLHFFLHMGGCCCCCHSYWFVGCLLSLHSHFKWVPDAWLCDFTSVPRPRVVGQANDNLVWGEKSGCRLFMYFFEPGRK